MRTELELVIIAIMLLVAALVVLTIFSGGLSQLGPLVNPRNNCDNSGRWACQTAGKVPDSWARDMVGPNKETCKQLLPTCQCVENTWLC